MAAEKPVHHHLHLALIYSISLYITSLVRITTNQISMLMIGIWVVFTFQHFSNAFMNILVAVSLNTCGRISVGCISRNGISGSQVDIHFQLYQLLPKTALQNCTNLCFLQQRMKVPGAFCLCLYLGCHTLKISTNLTLVKDAISVSTWISLVMCEVEHIFTCLLAIRVSSFMNNLSISFVHFFSIGVLPFSYCYYIYRLYIYN